MAETIVTRAPTRIDFGGGWTDVPPYSDEVGGYVCNVAINRFATVTFTPAGDGERAPESADRAIVEAAARRFRIRDARIEVASDFPIGAGLGGSSAVGVATVAALAAARGERMSPTAVAELSREIEISDLGIAGGRQDHYAASYGGALGLRFSAGRVEVREITLSPRARSELEQRCLVIYTGQSRISGETIDAVLGAYRAREPGVMNALGKMKAIAEEMSDALAAGHVDYLGKLVAAQWTHQRSLHPGIPTPLIDEIIERALQAGALGAKALGASGGGCVLIVTKANGAAAVRRSIEDLGEILSFTINENGVERCR